MAITATGAYVPAAHLGRSSEIEKDFVAVAERFLGVPYLWGGKTALGLDCSGLVQIALTACGIACPRDSDMQEAALGAPVAARIMPISSAAIWYSGKAMSPSSRDARKASSCQRVSHGGCDRAHRRSRRPHPRRRQPSDQRAADHCGSLSPNVFAIPAS